MSNNSVCAFCTHPNTPQGKPTQLDIRDDLEAIIDQLEFFDLALASIPSYMGFDLPDCTYAILESIIAQAKTLDKKIQGA